MKSYTQFAGLVGIVSLIFCLLTSAVVRSEEYYFIHSHLFVGILCLILYVLGGGYQKLKVDTLKSLTRKGFLPRWSASLIFGILFLGFLGFANYFSARQQWFRFDSTEAQVYSLSPQAHQVLQDLSEPLVFRGFFLGGKIDSHLKQFLELMATSYPDKVSWQVIDPEQKPQLAEKFGITEKQTLHISFSSGDVPRAKRISGMLSEETIVNGMLKLTRGDAKSIYFLKGHGEGDLSSHEGGGFSSLRGAIEDENLLVKDLMLSGGHHIPADASAILILGPKRPLLDWEIEQLHTYVQNGGRILVLSEPQTAAVVAKIVEPFGIEVGEDVVIDIAENVYSGTGLGVQPLITSFEPHAITHNFKEAISLVTASSLRRSHRLPKGITLTEIAQTSKFGWAEKNMAAVFSDQPQALLDEEDLRGPFPVAIAGILTAEPIKQTDNDAQKPSANKSDNEESKNEKSGRIVVIGDSDFVSNLYITRYLNRDFFLNSLNWVVGEEKGVTIRPRTLRRSTKVLTGRQYSAVFLVTAIFIPEVLMIFGLAVWWFRRV